MMQSRNQLQPGCILQRSIKALRNSCAGTSERSSTEMSLSENKIFFVNPGRLKPRRDQIERDGWWRKAWESARRLHADLRCEIEWLLPCASRHPSLSGPSRRSPADQE